MDSPLTAAQLGELLRACYDAADEQLRRDYRRSLSFQDATFDRWERARRLGFGEGASIYNSAAVFGEVRVGANTWVGPFTILDGSGGELQIGASCSLASGVHIYTHDTVLWALSGGVLPRAAAPVRIGDCVYIGSQSVIVAGVTVGSQCVIGANSFVNNDVPNRTVVAGSPARRIGSVVGDGADVRVVINE